MPELTPMVHYVLLTGMIILGILIALCLTRAIRGPRMTDRIVAVNAICTFVVIFICFLAFYLGEDYLIDIAILYSLLNLVTVAILTRVVVSHKLEKDAAHGKYEEESDL